MNLHELLSDAAYDLPVPAGAVAEVQRRSAQVRRRRRVLLATPAVALAVGLVPLLAGNGGRSHTLYGGEVRPTASPTPPPLPYQDPKAAVRMVCTDREYGSQDPYQGALDGRIVTGDPVADCARMGRQNGFNVPLTAYYNGRVSLVVVPAAWKLPAEFKPLPAGFRTDVRRVAASVMFEDRVDGLVFGNGRCLSDAEAKAEARDILDSVGLDYEINSYGDGPKANGSSVCAWVAFPTEDSKAVLLIDHDMSNDIRTLPTTGWYRFINELRTRIAERCLPLAQARQQVTVAAEIAHVPDYDVITTTAGGARCTRVDFQASGPRVPVILRHN